MPTSVRYKNQRSFGGGEIGLQTAGQLGGNILDRACLEIKNFDLVEAESMVARSPVKEFLNLDIGEVKFDTGYSGDTIRFDSNETLRDLNLRDGENEGDRYWTFNGYDFRDVLSVEEVKFFTLDTLQGGANYVAVLFKINYKSFLQRGTISPLELKLMSSNLEPNRDPGVFFDSVGYGAVFLKDLEGVENPKLETTSVFKLILAQLLRQIQYRQVRSDINIGIRPQYPISTDALLFYRPVSLANFKFVKVGVDRYFLHVKYDDGNVVMPIQVELREGLNFSFAGMSYAGQNFEDTRTVRRKRTEFKQSQISFNSSEVAGDGTSIEIRPYFPVFWGHINPSASSVSKWENPPSETTAANRANPVILDTRTITRVVNRRGDNWEFIIVGRVFPHGFWVNLPHSELFELDGVKPTAYQTLSPGSSIFSLRNGILGETGLGIGKFNFNKKWLEVAQNTRRDTIFWEGAVQAPLRESCFGLEWRLNELFPVSVFATMSRELYRRCSQGWGVGGFLIVRMASSTSNPDEFRDVICRVTQYNGYNELLLGVEGVPEEPFRVILSFPWYPGAGDSTEDNPSNTVFSPDSGLFFKRGATETLEQVNNDLTNMRTILFGARDNNNANRPYPTPRKIIEYAVPQFNSFDPPRVSVRVGDSQSFLTGQKDSDNYAISDQRNPFNFMGHLPQQSKFGTRRQIEAILRGDDYRFDAEEKDSEGNAVLDGAAVTRMIKPSAGAHTDRVYLYLFQINQGRRNLRGSPSGLPVLARFPLDSGEQVVWAEKLRSLIIGTNFKELRTQFNSGSFSGLSGIPTDNVQSFKGGSGLTAKGDYSIFFVSENKKQIHFIFYDDAVNGFRLETATAYSKDYFADGVRDIVWDNDRFCLFALSEGGRLAAFFLSREYNLQGWTEYQFPWLSTKTEPIRNVFRYKNDTYFSTSKRVFQLEKPDFEGVQQDPGGEDIESKVIFLKNPPRGDQGETDNYTAEVGVTRILGENVNELTAVGKRNKAKVKPQVPALDGRAQVFEVSSYVKNGILPTLEVIHKTGPIEAKKCRILNTTSRFEIHEE